MAAYKALIQPSTTLRNCDGYLNVTAWTARPIDARERESLWKGRGIKFPGLTNSNDFLATRWLIEEGSSDLLKENILPLAYINQESPRCIKKVNRLFNQKQSQQSVLNCILAPDKDAL